MRPSLRRTSMLAAVSSVVALTLAGCGGAEEGSAEPPPATQTPSATAETSTRPSESTPDDGEQSPDESAAETEDRAVEIEVEIENGQVTPSGERVDVQIGQPIRFVVDSDTADEIHVHSTPEHSFAFKGGVDDKVFQFKLQRPGVVEAELHELGDVLVTIAARP